MTQDTQSQCSVTAQWDGVGIDFREKFRMEETHVCLWLIHIDVWQNHHNMVK